MNVKTQENNKIKKLAIFASGTGSNARKIIEYFRGHAFIRVTLVVSNKATAAVLDMAKGFGVTTCVVSKSSFYETKKILEKLNDVDLIVLAGFLWLIPEYLVKSFPDQIVNIHPALLPKYGGKGMYGMNVHKAVKITGEKESGISIHFVNEAYDEGQLVFQKSCSIDGQDTAKDIATKVLKLEHQYFAPVIEQLLTK